MTPIDRMDDPHRPEFLPWFAASKVVDALGAPLVVFHGTRQNFGVFDAAQHGANFGGHPDSLQGFYFTPERWLADSIADNGYLPGTPRTVSVVLSIQNPAEIDMRGRDEIGLVGRMLAEAKARGHDGAIVRNWNDGIAPTEDDQGQALAIPPQYVAFEPEQIRMLSVPPALVGTLADADSARGAAMYNDQYREGEPGHADPEGLVWIEVSHYPISRLKDAVDAEWFAAEQTMWAEEGDPERFDDMLDGPILTPVVVHDNGEGGWTWDGNHRIGATLSKGEGTIAATVGLPRELFNALLRNPDPESAFWVVDPKAAGAREALDWLHTQQPTAKAVPRV